MRKISLIVISGITALTLCATDYVWNGAAGSFQADSNWTPIGVPGVADNAKFTTPGAYEVSFAGDAVAAASTVGADVTFDLNGYSWMLAGALGFSGSATATVGGGTLEIGSPVSVGANQKLSLNSGSLLSKGTSLGTLSGGAIEVNGGDHIISWALTLNAAAAGVPSLHMTGGQLSLTNNDSAARLNMYSGSHAALNGGTLNLRYALDMNGSRSNPSVFDINSNATVNCTGWGMNVCRSSGGLSIMNVNGGKLIFDTGSLAAVYQSGATVSTTGIINLVDGLIHVKNLDLAPTINAVGIYHQTGGQLEVWNGAYLGKYASAVGIMNIDGGSAWCNQLFVGMAAGATGEVNITKGVLTIDNQASAIGKVTGSCGRLFQSGGELILSNSFSIGAAPAACGVYTNLGGTLLARDTFYIGNNGGNTLTGSFGRAYFAGPTNCFKKSIIVGANAVDRGELIIADGSVSIESDEMLIGRAGTGTLAVVGGALLVPNSYLTAGRDAGSEGVVNISGGEIQLLGLTIGNSGKGSFSISDGVCTVTNGGAVAFGYQLGSKATVEISGGTNLFLGQGPTFGKYGSATVRITGGYTYTTNRIVVSNFIGATGRVELVGGILSTPMISGRDASHFDLPGGRAEILFDGGTLQHSVDGESWMPGSFVNYYTQATLTDRGAIIDSNGGILIISQALSNEVGYAGCFTKKGAGMLTLSSWYNAFTGCVTVEEGELAVSGNIHLSGGVVIDQGAVINLSAAGAVTDATTAVGTISRIDGTLILKSGVVLTNGVDAMLGGNGVVTGSVVFASGSAYARSKADGAGALQVTGSAVIEEGVAVELTGYTEVDLQAGIPLLTAAPMGLLQVSENLPVTLDGVSNPYWMAKPSPDGKTLTARVIFLGTMIIVR